MMTDPIADMLTRIRNANTAKHDEVRMPASKQKVALATLLQSEGYIAGFDVAPSPKGVGDVLTVTLTSTPNAPRAGGTFTSNRQHGLAFRALRVWQR